MHIGVYRPPFFLDDTTMLASHQFISETTISASSSKGTQLLPAGLIYTFYSRSFFFDRSATTTIFTKL
jgi:hypothetical protein